MLIGKQSKMGGGVHLQECMQEGREEGVKFDKPGHTLAKQVSEMQDGGGL